VSEDASFAAGPALSELAGLLLSTTTFEDLVQGVAELTVHIIDAAATCGITLSQDGRVITVGSADALAVELDEQQYENHTGPCLEALKSAEVVEAVDLATETRWGIYPAVAMGHGIRSVLSTPLIVNGESAGVLNLYAGAAHAFSEVDRRLALVLAVRRRSRSLRPFGITTRSPCRIICGPRCRPGRSSTRPSVL
jgi:GAF domain-containing protein